MKLITPSSPPLQDHGLVIPQRCRKCGKWYDPQRQPLYNMAGGRRFGPEGIEFSPRGMNFVADDGTCEDCNCDNPPGSGRNSQPCFWCPGDVGPASVLLSFTTPPTLVNCFRGGNFNGGGSNGIFYRYTVRNVGGSLCLPINTCSGVKAPFGDYHVYSHENDPSFSCVDGPTGNESPAQGTNPFTWPTGYGHLDAQYGQTPAGIGWLVRIVVTSQAYGFWVIFVGWTVVADCTTPVVIANTTGALGDSYSNTFAAGTVAGTGGSLVLTPRFALCP